eukprot:2167617-Pyramimonas_sp.AAC.1
MRHVELKDSWIQEIAARKNETKVSAGKIHANEITAEIGTKHLSRIDCTTHLNTAGAQLTGKGEVGGVTSPSEEKKGQISKPTLELMEASTRCSVGLGTFLQFGARGWLSCVCPGLPG